MDLLHDVNLTSLFKETISKPGEKNSIIHYDGNNYHRMTYYELDRNVKEITARLMSLHASHEVIGYLSCPNLALPAVLLSILEVSSAFAVIDAFDCKKYLENIKRFVSIRTILVDEHALQMPNLPLEDCWSVVDEIPISTTNIKVFRHTQKQCSCRTYSSENHKIVPNLAYVLQTSGTTGIPKVVQVPHHCIVPNIVDLKSIYGVNSKDRILLASSLTFDPSIVDIFLALYSGASLFIIPCHILCMPKILGEVIMANEITILQTTPSLLQTFERNFLVQRLLGKDTKLRIIALGGERCPSVEKLKLMKSPENATQIYNLYGLSEVSSWSTYKKIKFNDVTTNSDIPLGKPFSETTIAVVDESGEIINEGYGQLFVGGSKRWTLINDEQLPSSEGRMLPTGDWVHVSKCGAIFFEGRKDSMIKINGMKFYDNQVDRVLEQMPEVLSNVAFFCQDQNKLFIFIVSNSNQLEVDDLRSLIRTKLRSILAYIPAFEIVFVPEIPVTHHGKADCSKLLKFAMLAKKKKDENLSVETLRSMVSTMWKKFTRKDGIDDNDNFIVCGGNSILALEFASEIERETSLLCPTLVDTILNSTYSAVLQSLENVFRKSVRFSAESPVINSSENGLPVSETTKSSIGSEAAFVSNTKKTCYRMNRRGCSELHLSANCSLHCSLSFLEAEEHKTFAIIEKYKFGLKKCIDASPCVVSFFHCNLSICYIGSHAGVFLALDIKQGVIMWEKQLPDRIESSACLSSCGQFILVGCYDSNLYCFNAQNGQTHWTVKMQAEVKSSPVVSLKNVAFVGCHDHLLYAVDVQDGTVLWSKKIGEGSIFSSPTIFENLIFAATLDGILAALDENSGNIVWSFKYGKPLFSSPMVFHNSVFIGCADGFMLHFGLEGNLISKYSTNGPVFSSATPLAGDAKYFKQNPQKKKGIVFGSHDGRVYCFSHCGKELWTFQCDSPVYATPVSYITRSENRYVVGASVKGRIFILNAENGNELCSFQCPGEVFSTPVVLDRHLVVGCRDNNVYVFKLLGIK